MQTVLSNPPKDISRLAGVPVAVTGATGFIGSALVRALVAAGAEVTALHRSGHGRARLHAVGAIPVEVPLESGDRLLRALSGQRILFHFAYDVRAGGAANLEAFDAALSAAKNAGVERIVHAGSAVVYDSWPEGRVDERAPCEGPVTDEYRVTKRAMDRKLLAGSLAAAILQPTIVYGPGSPLWINRPVAMMRQGGVVLPEPAGSCPAVFVDDVVQAALRAALLPDLGRERFVISGSDDPEWLAYWQAIRDLAGSGDILRRPLDQMQSRLGPRPPVQQIAGPSIAARISASARQAIGHERFERLVAQMRSLRGPTGPVWPDHAALELYAARPSVGIETARARLGYEPVTRFADGIKACRMTLNN